MLAAVVPVLTLAFVIRAYFADLLRDAVQAEAARTAAVAQRVIQQSDELGRRNNEEITPGSDDVLVSISQVIEQDVNIFDGAELLATSERDLFSSGFLPTRTPDDVYRAIVLDRLPSFVDEDQIGTVPYIIAAAPVRTGESDRILTVPLANRQREIEREIDDLDRGVHLAVLCFVLLGAAIGLSLAERIADPVRRLTRATRRIASGDFDARIAVRSADELRRLVDAFNSMASELKAQRTQLERTHRLEAWAEMARQVAHEIKNPLTPIQLSAEHLRRVHADRGEPLGPVLESCVDVDPRSGAAAAADLRGVLQLCVLADRPPGAGGPPGARGRSRRSLSHRALPAASTIDNRVQPPAAAACSSTARSSPAPRQHRRERAPRDARRGSIDHRRPR